MAFFFSPKSGGTSLRAFLFHAENGFAFRDYSVQGARVDANMLAANYRFNRIDHSELEGYRRFALVRDPVRRFLSGYSNRVLHYRELSIEAAGQRPAARGFAARSRHRDLCRELHRLPALFEAAGTAFPETAKVHRQ
ncbi:MAG: sulfotransferase family 2 domain-containing protein [Roseicyclus sp.]|uniref:sulfotransferase family 2 domain-containing protein n=1 Tax=Roseicyclus sp. TaxID=1914329 RepID=UPI003A882C1C